MTMAVDIRIPTSKDEEWRFTPLGGLSQVRFEAPAAPGSVSAAELAPYRLGDAAWPTVVVVDGRVDATLSHLPALPGGARLLSLTRALAEGDATVEAHLQKHVRPDATPFTTLNASLFVDGVVLHVPAGVALPHPVHVIHVATAAASGSTVAPRTLVQVERGASAAIIESFVALGGSGYFTDPCAELVLAENARLEHVRVQREATDAWHIGFTQVDQQRDSHYRSFTLNLGGRLARHNLHAKLNAPNIETLLYGLYLTSGEQVVDNHTAIFHDQPNCNSWEVYKGVLADRSRAVFNGKVFVQPEAQKTDAKQTNRNLLLSDQAKVDTKPQLEIFADDVKCTHGATVGRLDELQRYYLQTRGIAGKTAQALLIWAFAAEVMAEITIDPVREALETLVRARLDEMIG